jgi:hypothetical protein
MGRRRAFIWPGVFVAILATVGSAHAAPQQDPAPAELPPRAITLSVVPPFRPPRFGEPVCITIVLANSSAQDVWYLHAAPPVDYTYDLVDEHGERVRFVGRPFSISNLNASIPGNGEARIPVQLDALMAIDHPGTYTLNLSTTLGRRPPAAPIPLTAKPVTIVIRDEVGKATRELSTPPPKDAIRSGPEARRDESRPILCPRSADPQRGT